MALLATLIFQIWVALPAGSNNMEQMLGEQKETIMTGNNTATAVYTDTTWEFVNTTTESNTPMDGVYISEHIISTWEEKWDVPGTPVNETVTLFFSFILNATTQENTSSLFFGNINIMVWFIGYEYDNTMKNATPYQSETIAFNTEEALQNPDISEHFTIAIIGDRCVYNYTGTIRHLFETQGNPVNDSFITATKMYYISEINRPIETTMSDKSFNTETWNTKERVWANGVDGWWWYENDIRNYYGLYTENIPRLTLYGTEKQTKYFLSTIPEGAAHRKQLKHWYDNNYDDPYTGGHVNMYASTFQIYVLPGTQNIQVNVTIGTDTNYKDITPKGNKYFFITDNMSTKFNTVTDSVTGDIRHIFEKGEGDIVKDQTFIYNFNSALVDWNYITVFTTLPGTHVTITTKYVGAQNPRNLTDAIRIFDMLSTDKIGKLWYSAVIPGNTTITHNITKTSQTYTLWDNKTYTYHYYNNSEGADNITINNITCINGTWTPEITDINNDMLTVNPENINGTDPDIWFLKYTYTIYKCTVVEAEKTIDSFTFTYNYTYNVVFDYTQKMLMPIEFEIDTLEGKLTPCVDSTMLVYYPELLMISQNYFNSYNKNITLGFIQPDLNKSTCQGTYLKNVWMIVLPNPVVYGNYTWVPPEGKIRQYHHYEVLLPWSLYHNYTCVVDENRWLSVDANLRPDEFIYDYADKSYYYTVTDEQIFNDDFQYFNITMSLRINLTIYEDGSVFDYEEYIMHQKQRLDVHKINPDRIKIYLKEDIWEQQNTYQPSLYPMTYKVYTFTPQKYGYNETGINSNLFTSQGYPYLGFIFRCSSEYYNNLFSNNYSSNISLNDMNLTGLMSEIENITGEDIPDELLNITPYINMPQYFNASFTIYTLDADRVFPAYQQYAYTLSPSILIAITGLQGSIDEAAFEDMKDRMQDAFEKQNMTDDTANITFTMIQNFLPENTQQYFQSTLISMNTTATIVKIKTQKIEETSIVGFFDITKIDDTTNISFRTKDSWTTTEINNLLDTDSWLTYVEPMKAQLVVDVDKTKPEKNENVNVTIQLLIGNNGKATIDGGYAAANQPLLVTYPDQNGNIVTEKRYTNSTGGILMNFTAPGKEFVFTVSYDTTKMYVGSAVFSKKIGAMSLWDFIQGLMGPLIIIGIFLIIILITYDSFRRVIWGRNRPWRILK